MTLYLEAPRLILRSFQDSDLEPFLAYRNDPEVAKYQSWNIPYPRESGMQFIELMKISNPNTQGEWYQAAVELKSTREMIGDVAFCTMAYDEKQALMGYSLARPCWIGRLRESCDYVVARRCSSVETIPCYKRGQYDSVT